MTPTTTRRRWILSSAIAAGLTAAVVVGVVSQAGSGVAAPVVPTEQSTVATAEQATAEATPVATPTPIDIPNLLHVDAWSSDHTIVPVGLTAEGALVPPADLQQLGWWQDGAAPSDDAGTIVLTSHRDSNALGQGPFAKLEQLPVGSTISVDGERYVLTALDTYGKDALPTQEVFAQTGQERLVIVTCGGTFTGHHWDSNVVGTFVPA